MNRTHFSTVIIKNEGVRLDYYLLSSDERDIFGNLCTKYGIEIRQMPLHTFSLCAYLCCSLPDIGTNKQKITVFLRKLSESQTDPSCLEDIVDEQIENLSR